MALPNCCQQASNLQAAFGIPLLTLPPLLATRAIRDAVPESIMIVDRP